MKGLENKQVSLANTDTNESQRVIQSPQNPPYCIPLPYVLFERIKIDFIGHFSVGPGSYKMAVYIKASKEWFAGMERMAIIIINYFKIFFKNLSDREGKPFVQVQTLSQMHIGNVVLTLQQR